MQTFEELSKQFIEKFTVDHFPKEPSTLYEPNNYFLALGGKRVRPVMCLMGNELFDEIKEDAWDVANAYRAFSQLHIDSRRHNGQGTIAKGHANCSS
jgi:geranylgeranyl diphosphate synthase type II